MIIFKYKVFDDVVTSFTSYLYESVHSIFGKQTHNPKNFNKSQTNKRWFNKECQIQKREFNKIRNAFIKNKTDTNKSNFIISRSKYNKIKRKAKSNFKISEGKRLHALAKKEPRKFWKSLKKKYKKTRYILKILQSLIFLSILKPYIILNPKGARSISKLSIRRWIIR